MDGSSWLSWTRIKIVVVKGVVVGGQNARGNFKEGYWKKWKRENTCFKLKLLIFSIHGPDISSWSGSYSVN